MSRFIHVTIISLCAIILALPALADDTRINQKVIRKNITIVPKQVETPPPIEQIKEIDTTAVPEKPPVHDEITDVPTGQPSTLPAALPALTPAVPLTPKTGIALPPWQAGSRLGQTAPGLGIFGDLYMFPFKLADNSALFTRASLGYVSGTYSGFMGQLAELLFIKPDHSEVTFFGGAGLGIPFVSKGKLSYNLIIGAEKSITLFNLKDEAIAFETGIGNYAVDTFTTDRITLLLGYKFTL